MKRIQTMHVLHEQAQVGGRNCSANLPLPEGEGRGEGEGRTKIIFPELQLKSGFFILAVMVMTGSSVGAAESVANLALKPKAQGDTNVAAVVQAPAAGAAPATPSPTNDAPVKSLAEASIPKTTNGNGTNELRMNF